MSYFTILVEFGILCNLYVSLITLLINSLLLVYPHNSNHHSYIHLYVHRFEKRHRNMSVHCSPAFLNVKEGDIVTVGQCRPLAKTVKFNVLEHTPAVNTVRERK